MVLLQISWSLIPINIVRALTIVSGVRPTAPIFETSKKVLAPEKLFAPSLLPPFEQPKIYSIPTEYL